MEVAAKPACGWQRPVELNDKPRLAVDSADMAVPKTPTTFRDCHI